jgi:hypothetical protein
MKSMPSSEQFDDRKLFLPPFFNELAGGELEFSETPRCDGPRVFSGDPANPTFIYRERQPCEQSGRFSVSAADR